MFTKKRTCELVMVVDRSGSMSSCKGEVIEGMNKLVAEQKKLPGRCFLTSIIFDHEYKVWFESRDIRTLGYIGDENYVPRGSTALYDAIGRTIEACRVRFDRTKPDEVICVIVTDGRENASKEFTQTRIKKMVGDLAHWKFVFIGADQDAVLTAKSVAMPSMAAMSVTAGPIGMRQGMAYACNATSALRGGGEVNYASLQEAARTNGAYASSTPSCESTG